MHEDRPAFGQKLAELAELGVIVRVYPQKDFATLS